MTPPTGSPHHEELRQILKEVFEDKIPFNQVLGLRLEFLGQQEVCIKLDMRDEFIGNYQQGILHGGVISAVLDVMGGITAYLGVLQKMADQPLAEKYNRFMKLGTIDLRVDYLRPGRGKHFIARGTTLRTGSRVAVTRMEFLNEEDLLIAVGTGTYIVG